MASPTTLSLHQSLAAVRSGETVIIRHVLFDSIRTYCEDLGLRQGEPLHCQATAPSRLILQTVCGRTVLFDRDWARFVEVDPVIAGAVKTRAYQSRPR